MEAGTIAPGASAEEQERLAQEARDADKGANGNGGAVERDTGGSGAGGASEEDEEADLLELAIEGDGQLTLTVGGAKPDSSIVKLSAAKISVDGGDFDKGQEVKFLVHGVVSSVEFKDHRDQYGNLSATERIHKVRAMRIERLKD